MNQLPLLRPRVSLPRSSCDTFLKSRSQRLAIQDLQDRIWREFLARLGRPIRVIRRKNHRVVNVLGCVKYFISYRDGKIHAQVRTRPGLNSSAFLNPALPFLVDLPLRLNAFVIEAFLSEWKEEALSIASGNGYDHAFEEALDRADTESGAFWRAFVQSFLKAVSGSVYWKRLRYRVRDAIGIDEEFLNIFRLSRPDRRDSLRDNHFNNILIHQERFRRLYRESPGLVWLYALALEAGLEIEGDTLQAIKSHVIDAGIGERGWRLIAKSDYRDFACAVEFMANPWAALLEYVRLHNALDRNVTIPLRVQHLFGEPIWRALPDGKLTYRGAEIPPALLNTYINACLAAKDTRIFLSEEASLVFAWLSGAKPDLDKNQCKRGWGWLYKRAVRWRDEATARERYEKLVWEISFGETTLRGYRFVPLCNAWEVMHEAVTYRHCADGFLEECQHGIYRLFSVFDLTGRHKATLGMAWSESGWVVDQVKGFANRAVSNELFKICSTIPDALDLVDEGRDARAAFKASVAADHLKEVVEEETFADGANDYACPVCNEPDGSCGHLVASFDLYFDGLCDGLAYDAIKGWYGVVSDILRICIETNVFSTGLGEDFDNILLNYPCSFVRSGEAGHDASPEEYRKEIELSLCRLLAHDDRVYSGLYHFNGTVFENYWAEEPGMAIDAAGKLLEDCLKKMQCQPDNKNEFCHNKLNRSSGAEGGLHP